MKHGALLERYYLALQYELRLQEAAENFQVFCEMMMPGADPDDPYDSAYTVGPFHEILCEVGQKIEAGRMIKGLVSAPPRHGKSWTITTLLAAWFFGRNPEKDIITATYSKEIAESKFSNDFLKVVSSRRFTQVFPNFRLSPDQNRSNHRQSSKGGNAYFVGRRSMTTGLGGDLILIDDPIKDDREARLETYRDDLWSWFRKTIYTRRHRGDTPILVTVTRWTADDIIGRISDPENVHYSKEFASDWKIINIPALATEDNDIVGRMKGEALWPEKFSAEELKKLRAADAIGFSCLYQGNPVPDEGVLFTPGDLVEYERHELAEVEGRLMIYIFSDHAYGTGKTNDPSCFAPVGIAPNGDAYFLPDLFWDKATPDTAVDRMIEMIHRRRPLEWIAENHHVFKTLEPFLRKRMTEENCITTITPVWPRGTAPGKGKTERCMGALARCRMGKVKFPAFAPWWHQAKQQLLTFPNGNNDDFVDVLSLFGLQIDRIYSRSRRSVRQKVQEGTWEWWFGQEERGQSDLPNMTGRSL